MKDDDKQQKLDIEDVPQLYDVNTVGEYSFEPIKGYPMLHWKGKRPFTSTRYYPAQRKERHGTAQDNWFNQIFWGDNLQVMSHLLKAYRGQVQLVYIDPPFDSKADYKKKVKLKGKSTTNDANAFEEKQYHDIWTNDEYLQFIFERIILIKELLAENGCIYLHCDWHKGQYLRCLMDEIFGADSFVNEVIWQRISAHPDSKFYGHVHDNILFYAKNKNLIGFNTLHTPYPKEFIERYFTKDDNDGRGLYWTGDLTAPGPRPGLDYEFKGYRPSPGRVWFTLPDKMEKLVQDNRIYFPPKGGIPKLKRYLNEYPGIPVTTLWSDLKSLAGLGANNVEKTNYPTQKPEALLERIIKASSNPGDLVFDCFMGSGTTQAVAMKLGRRFIGADINLGAVQITTKRLLNVAAELNEQQRQATLTSEEDAPDTFYTGFEVYNVNHYDVFRNPVQARDLLIEALELQPLPQGHVYDGEQDGCMFKIMPVNRIATRADLNELIHNFDLKAFERRQAEHPKRPVEKIRLVCMGHEPDLANALREEALPYTIDVKAVDILRDRQDLQFKRDSEAQLNIRDGELHIETFYPMNLLAKLSLEKERVDDWRELVESIMVDWNYDGAVFEPTVTDIPDKKTLVTGVYRIPEEAGTIRVKITDLLSESWEGEIEG